MKKDFIRDYATAAFRFYACRGQPCAEDEEIRIRTQSEQDHCFFPPQEVLEKAEANVKRQTAALLDILAVDSTKKLLSQNGRGFVWRAVEIVYCEDASSPLHKNDLTRRVTCASRILGVSESNVYRFLREARKLFASFRGLRLS